MGNTKMALKNIYCLTEIVNQRKLYVCERKKIAREIRKRRVREMGHRARGERATKRERERYRGGEIKREGAQSEREREREGERKREREKKEKREREKERERERERESEKEREGEREIHIEIYLLLPGTSFPFLQGLSARV